MLASAWLDKVRCWSLRDLGVGTCYEQIGSKVRLIRVALFELKQKRRKIEVLI